MRNKGTHRKRSLIVRILTALGAMAIVAAGTSTAMADSPRHSHALDSGLITGQLAQVAKEISGHHFAPFTYVGCQISVPGRHGLGCLVITVSQSSVSMSWGNGSPASTTAKPAIPSWLHIGKVVKYRDCAPHHGGAPGVFVWQKSEGNGTAALHCKNGRTFLS